MKVCVIDALEIENFDILKKYNFLI